MATYEKACNGCSVRVYCGIPSQLKYQRNNLSLTCPCLDCLLKMKCNTKCEPYEKYIAKGYKIEAFSSKYARHLRGFNR